MPIPHSAIVSQSLTEPPIVVKIGGSTLGGNDTSLQDLVALHRAGRPIVIVHGGGNVISDWMQRQNLAPNFVNGLRVTDAPRWKSSSPSSAGWSIKNSPA